ncbi:MAG: PAS-domain containing protein, partial [Acidobacteria bacterium]|nr:PAS-domain containing protein [Acidobacteriota bacterium]
MLTALRRAVHALRHTGTRHDEDLNRALDEAARQRDLFYSIINAASDGLLLYDTTGQLVTANQRAAELLAVAFSELFGRASQDPHDDIEGRSADPATYREAMAMHFASPDASHEDRLELREPRRRVLRRYSRPFFQGGQLAGRVFTYTDVTTESDLDRMKSEFVSTASHELRTPLTSIHGALQLALAGSGHKLDEEDRELLRISLASTDRLVRLVNDLLDLSKIEAGRMPFDILPVDVRGLLEESARAMQGLASQRSASLVIHGLPDAPAVPGDHDHLMRVMTNLVSNALKYAPERSEVRLAAVPTSQGVEIRVEDQGPGIPANQLDRLFQPFSRVGIHERQTAGGTGLGLAISRAIVEQHGGKIWAERLEPRGTRFAFLLPYAEF